MTKYSELKRKYLKFQIYEEMKGIAYIKALKRKEKEKVRKKLVKYKGKLLYTNIKDNSLYVCASYCILGIVSIEKDTVFLNEVDTTSGSFTGDKHILTLSNRLFPIKKLTNWVIDEQDNVDITFTYEFLCKDLSAWITPEMIYQYDKRRNTASRP